MRKTAIAFTAFGIAMLSLTACTLNEPRPMNDSANTPPPPQLSTLAGSEWGFGDQSERFVRFDGQGRVNGSGGCNNFFGAYSHEGRHVQIGPLASTKKMCAPDLMQGEQDFMNALAQTRQIDATHLVLILSRDDGTTLATLQRRDWD